ncbi:polyprenyl synthetase family protein [Spirillospora sp. CA-294931]|uniref:polyprenyl synthetase family protein n=1 Tax=Spirillospora sp. CA-294931 TaxID=3240042 RepID=UPI003D93E5B7
MTDTLALDDHTAMVVDRLRALVAGIAGPAGGLLSPLLRDPGKCLRSLLLGAAARCGVHDTERTVRLGAVVELLHLASLVHDDVIDDAGTRRGGPAVHVVAGRELAVLAGLACLALAGTEAAELGPDVDRAVSRTAAELALGEMLDVQRAFDAALPLEDYRLVVERKTGALFGLCCALGAASGGLSGERVRALAGFGRDLGVAFQILDDCLDLAPVAGGKPVGTDHLLGLFGAPTLFALRSDPSGALAALLLAPSFSAADLPEVRRLVNAAGGVDAARDWCRAVHRDAVARLDVLDDGPARDALVRVAGLTLRTTP